MKVSELMARLNEALEWAKISDADVVIGEASGIFRPRLSVTVQRTFEDEASYEVIIQAYVVKDSDAA